MTSKMTKKGEKLTPEKTRELASSNLSTPSALPLQLPACLAGFDLSTPERARESLGLVIHARAAGAIDKELAQSLTWMLSVYLPAHRSEKWGDLERRIKKLEEDGKA